MLSTQLGASDDWRAAVRRLATDPRRERVWRELQRRRRGQDGAYVNAAPEWLWAAAPVPEARQVSLMHWLFITAVNNFFGSPPAITKTEIEKRRRRVLKLSESFRDNLDQLRTLGGFRNVEAALTAAIAELDHQAESVGRGYRPDRIAYSAAVIDRHRGDPKLRTFLEALADEISGMLGSPLYGTVAIIASVLFGRTVSRAKVREAHTMLVAE